MDFYTRLAEYYDLLFAPGKELRSWTRRFAAPGPLLDAGCATGELTLEPAADGIECCGFDSDSRMIKIARKKAAGISDRLPVAPAFRVDTLQECRRAYDDAFFGTLICLGNTLPHLADEDEVARVLIDFRALLGENSCMALQLLNYDRILDERPAELPPLVAEIDGKSDMEKKISFFRHYRYEKEAVLFSGRLRIEAGSSIEEHESETRLLALGREPLLRLCKHAGFRNTALSGDYNETPADGDSFFYLLTASTAP